MNMPILTQTIQIADKQTSLIQYKSVPVMTTEQMAEFYGTDSVNIRKNYTRNAERFIVCAVKEAYKKCCFLTC